MEWLSDFLATAWLGAKMLTAALAVLFSFVLIERSKWLSGATSAVFLCWLIGYCTQCAQ